MIDPNQIKQTFAKRLRGLREAAGLTQKGLADKLNYSRGSISYYENCDRVPDIVFLMTVSDFFNVSPHFLLGFTDNQKSANEDIGLRFGLSDHAIDILEKMDLSSSKDFLSAFIEHEAFPKLFDCMKRYLDGFSLGQISPDIAMDEHDFRHFQITRILMAILDDMQKNLVMFGSHSPLQDVDEQTLLRYYEAAWEKSNADFVRTIARYESGTG